MCVFRPRWCLLLLRGSRKLQHQREAETSVVSLKHSRWLLAAELSYPKLQQMKADAAVLYCGFSFTRCGDLCTRTVSSVGRGDEAAGLNLRLFSIFKFIRTAECKTCYCNGISLIQLLSCPAEQSHKHAKRFLNNSWYLSICCSVLLCSGSLKVKWIGNKPAKLNPGGRRLKWDCS